jgi:DNA-binding MarR family transcriptional regulator
MVRSIDDLEARDLCVRKPAEHDRRAHAVALTPHGEEIFARAERDARAVGRELMAGFDPAERAQLTTLLARFIED